MQKIQKKSNGVKKTRVLVTGASGFIGRNLFETLSQRDDLDVLGTYHSKTTRILPYILDKADLMKKEDAERVTKDIDIVIHAAAISAGAKYIVDYPDFQMDNTAINTNLLQAVYKNNVKHFVFLSCSVLYPMDLGRPVKEDDVDYNRIHPKYHAGAWIKIYGEKLCEFYSKLGKTKFTVIRHSNIYGPYDKFNLEYGHVFAATIVKAVNTPNGGKMAVWGDGQEERDLLHVSDLSRFIEMAISNGDWRYEIFNVGYGKVTSVADLTAKIINAAGKELVIAYDRSKPTIENSKLVLDFSHARRFGWQPEVDLNHGIRQTVDWYKEYYRGGW